MRTDEWADQAACANTGARGFMVTRLDQASARMALDVIARYCSKCTVRTECDELAQEPHMCGVLGGRLYPDQWARGGKRPVGVIELHDIVNGDAAGDVPARGTCPGCGRRGMAQFRDGSFARHIDYTDGQRCGQGREEAS